MKTIEFKDKNLVELLNKVLDRGVDNFVDIDATVDQILKDIKINGNKALYDYTLKFDKVALDNLQVSKDEIEKAVELVGKDFIDILKRAANNIEDYHKKQVQNSWITNEREGITLGQLIRPIERVGIYVPGGKAAYPSTVLMNAIPAKVAGVGSIAMVTPPDKSGNINPYINKTKYLLF